MKQICLLFISIFLLLSCGEEKENYELDLESFPSMDFEEAVKSFEESDKPILVYFNAFGGVNCRRFEKTLKEGVGLEKIKLKYNFINLHLDDRTRLPDTEWFKYRKHILKTKGAINQMIQTEKLQTGSQPYLAIMNKEGDVVKSAPGYGLNIKEFLELED